MKRITIFAGHYGSGKTNIAVNYAINLKKSGRNVIIADLDIVNPYFRTKDSEKLLESLGIRLISSEYANSNVDVPAISAQSYAVTDDKESYAVIDVGGDDRGALALGRFSDKIKEENNYDMFFVINKFRPLTATPQLTAEVMHEIENAAGIKFTGIVNNSNLGDETSENNIRSSFEYANEVSRLTGLNIYATSVKEDAADSFKDVENLMPINIYVRQIWNKEE